MHQQTYDHQTQLKLYWHSNPWFSPLERLPDDAGLDQRGQDVAVECPELRVSRGVEIGPPCKPVNDDAADSPERNPSPPYVVSESHQK